MGCTVASQFEAGSLQTVKRTLVTEAVRGVTYKVAEGFVDWYSAGQAVSWPVLPTADT